MIVDTLFHLLPDMLLTIAILLVIGWPVMRFIEWIAKQ